MTSFLKTGVTTLLIAGSVAAFGLTAANTNRPIAWGENTAVVHGQNLPGGQSEMGKTDIHLINLGYRETCRAETWVLPFEYESVAEFLEEHPDAKPDYSGAQSHSNKCEFNAHQEFREKSGLPTSYYSGITGSIHKFAVAESYDQDKI